MASQPSCDRDIRQALAARLTQRHARDADVVIVEELPVARGASRLDMAVINGRVEGFEIKSSLDTLDRLQRQVRLASPAMERATLVAAPEHLSSAERELPRWWSIVSAEKGGRGAVHLKRVRQGHLNPHRDPAAFIGLLERQEIIDLLSQHGMASGVRSAALFELGEHAVRYLPRASIFAGVRQRLKIRAFLAARYSTSRFGGSARGSGIAADAPSFMSVVPAP